MEELYNSSIVQNGERVFKKKLTQHHPNKTKRNLKIVYQDLSHFVYLHVHSWKLEK